MKHKRLLFLICILSLFLAFLSYQKNIAPEVRKILDAEFKMVMKTEDIPVTFADGEGNTIVCHCLATEYYQSSFQETAGIHWQVIREIIDPETADAAVERTVNGKEAMLCHRGERAYLCWTLTEEYSFVIEYTPSAVTEEEIFQMAQSLQELFG